MVFLGLLIIPMIIAIGFFVFSKHSVTLIEFLIHAGAQCLLALISMLIIYSANTWDAEVRNGVVSSKAKERVSCSHSYSCNCRNVCSGSGKNRSCSRVCSTCYEHSHDIAWAYYTTDDGRSTIDRVDRQGLREPPRWSSIQIGEPSSSTHGYENYIKAAPDSLFRYQGLVERFKDLLPKYPDRIYDYYHIHRVVLVNTQIDTSILNKKLEEANSRVGKPKQANLVLVLATDQPQQYFHALEQHWIGGKKNDIILVVGLDKEQNITWTSVMAWTDNKFLQVKLRDEVAGLGKFDGAKVLELFEKNVTDHYERKPMKDFEYLKASITPTVTEWITSLIIGILISIGLGIFFIKNDVA